MNASDAEIVLNNLVGSIFQEVRLHCGEVVNLGSPEARFIADFIVRREAALQSLVKELEYLCENRGLLIDHMGKEVDDLQSQLAEMRASKDQAYKERNQLVAYLSRCFESHLCLHPASDETWDKEWLTIVCIHTPAGQMTWHLHDSDAILFPHLKLVEAHWDGHSTDEKYRRLQALSPRAGEERNEMKKLNDLKNQRGEIVILALAGLGAFVAVMAVGRWFMDNF
jgi:hypothetical protein